MPDASITSTESTFGTISGTFTADQSTISGTITAITGTVDGSVGVPGPQGPAGSPGAQGPQGPQGVPGVGVPTGGTTGQVLQKASATAYDTVWATPSGGTWGSITGTLSNQTDLQSALDAKQNVSGMSAYLSKAGNLSGLTDLAAARDNLNLGTLNTPVFNGVTAQGSGLNVANLGATYLTLNHTGYGQFIIQPSTGITFPDATIQTTAYPGPVGATSWGSIVGTLSNQTDLQTALNGKAPSAAGMPISGTIGQVLTKNSGTSYDASWQSFIPGDRYVTTSTSTLSVSNGTKSLTIGTGLAYTPNQDVTISLTSDPTLHHMHGPVTSYNSGTGALVVDVQNHTGSGTFSSWTVNVGGTVPLETVEWGEVLGTLGDQTDLATALNAKLEITDAASTYYLQTNPAGYIDSSALTGYATESWVTSQGYLTSSALTGYATESWVTSQGYLTSSALTGYATESWVTAGFYPLTGNPSGFITSSALTPYATLAGATFTGEIVLPASTTATASLTIPHGSAPTTPVNGEVWTTTSGLFVRVNGTTRQYVDFDGTQTINGSKTFSNANQTLGNSTAAGTINVGTGATISGATKAVNLGTSGVAGSTTNITIGSTTGTSTTTLQGITNGVTQSAGDSSLKLATTAFVTTADNLKANLASPALTGTPTAPTATAGTNTTQIATTAFVTAAVPATATHLQSLQFAASSFAKVSDNGSQVIAPSILHVWPSPSNYNGTATSGAGASAALYLTGYILTAPSAGVAGNARAYHGNIAGDLAGMLWGGSGANVINFSRRVSMAFRFAQYPSDNNSITRVLLGKIHGTAVGDLATRGIGVKYVPSGGGFYFYLQVHNGTTLTNVVGSTQYAGGVADLEVVSDGAGNATLYLNGASIATSNAAPTGQTGASATVFAEIESTASTTVQTSATIGRLYVNSNNF